MFKRQNNTKYRHIITEERVILGIDKDMTDEEISLLTINPMQAFVDGCAFAINTPKSIAGRRIIPMLPKVKKAFLLEKKYQEELGIKCNVTVDGYTDFIFINRFGGVQHQGTLNKALRRIIRDCNYEVLDNKETIGNEVILPRFSNHSLRHTFTTRMCEAGVNIKAMFHD